MTAGRRMAAAVTALTLVLVISDLILRHVFTEARGSADLLTLLPMVLVLAAVGGLVAARRPDNSYGWVVASVALTWAISGLAMDYAALALAKSLPGALPSAALGVVTASVAWGMFVTFVLLLYPTGTLPGRRWRWVGRAAAAGIAFMTIGLTWSALKNGAGEVVRQFAAGTEVQENGAALAFNSVGHILLFSAMLAGVVSLFVRRTHATEIERLQLKWFASGAALVAISILFAPLIGVFWLEVVALTAMPVVIGIAILRWHLYDIDRIVSRTLAYALLTALLVGIYLAAVTALTTFLAPVADDSAVAVAAATLLAAAAFQPARRRIQTLVDQRFNRARYDARRTIDDFATSLRQEVDIDDVRTHLIDTVGEVLEPREVTVWLQPGTVAR